MLPMDSRKSEGLTEEEMNWQVEGESHGHDGRTATNSCHDYKRD